MTAEQLSTPEDLERLFITYHQELYNYIYLRCGRQKEVAEDMVQQVFLTIWKLRDSYTPQKSSLRNWLYRIARSDLIDYYRKKSTHANVPIEEKDLVVKDTAYDDALLESIYVKMKELEEPDRELLILHYVQGLDAGSIARIIGKNYIATKVSICRAIKKLKRLVTEQHE